MTRYSESCIINQTITKQTANYWDENLENLDYIQLLDWIRTPFRSVIDKTTSGKQHALSL